MTALGTNPEEENRPSASDSQPLRTASSSSAGQGGEGGFEREGGEGGAASAAGDVAIHPSNPQPPNDRDPSQKRKREQEDEDVENPAPLPEGESAGVTKEEEGSSALVSNSSHPLWKTSLCSYFRRKSGSCSHENTCRYAHGEAELRPRPDDSWDPTSQRGKLLKSDEPEGSGIRPGKTEVAAAPSAPPVAEVEDVVGCSEGETTAVDKCLVGLPMKWASDKLKSFLETQGIPYKTAKKKKGMTVGFVSFADVEQVKSAVEGLNGKSMGGKHIKFADVIRRSHENKPTFEVSLDQRKLRSTKCHSDQDNRTLSVPSNVLDNVDVAEDDSSLGEGLVSKTRSARDVVTPLADMPYSDQLEHKKNLLLQTLKRLTRNARKACPDGVPLPDWILKSRDIGGLPCKLEGILESPLTYGYRNKCEFSVGYSLQGKKTVGFMLGNFREGMTAVEEPANCPNISTISCKYAFIFQKFLQSSELPVWNRINNTGFWRQFTVREGRNPCQIAVVENVEAEIADVMLIVQVCSSGVNEEVMNGEIQKMAQALSQGASACSPLLPLTSLVVQDHNGISNAAPVDCPLLSLPIPKMEIAFGSENQVVTDARIHDYISNLRFSISPTAFFQVNTLAAEKLYSLAGDWADLNSDTLLFDICCGTGTIGLTLAHRVGMVVGIEMNDSAVSDARRNAEINGIKNCMFVCAKAEDVMGALLKEYLNVLPKDSVDSDNSKGNNGSEILDSVTSTYSDLATNGTTKERCLEDRYARDLELSGATELQLYENPSHSESDADQNEHNGDHTPIYSESLNNQFDDIKSSSGSHKSCPTECREASQESHIPEEKKEVNAAPMQQFKNVVAIVDPPRAGLHPVVIKALRTHPCLRRLVYISCNPESLVANAIEFCTPTSDKPQKGKNNRGWRKMSSAGLARHRAKSMPNSEPFRPVKAMAVDLFPHTLHCEMVMLLER